MGGIEYSVRIRKEDVENLMNEILPFGEKMLEEHGEFLPYGGVINAADEIIHVSPDVRDGETTDSIRLADILRESLKEMALDEKCKATAIVLNISTELPSTGQKSDAIQMNLEHVSDYSAEVFFPYKINHDDGIIWGEVFAQEGRCEIFSKK